MSEEAADSPEEQRRGGKPNCRLQAPVHAEWIVVRSAYATVQRDKIPEDEQAGENHRPAYKPAFND